MIKIMVIFGLLNIGLGMASPNDSIPKKIEAKVKTDSAKVSDFYKSIEKQLKQYIPDIRKVLKDNFKKVSKHTLENDELMRYTFEKSYPLLPLPVRLIVNQEEYVRFCIKNKNSLIK